jgi:di/tricarboxylate transporter
VTVEIAIVLSILIVAIVLFVTEWIRMDLVALLVLVAVAITGQVTPAEALSGFSNPAVVTVWAMFIISGGLTVTGVADRIGQRLIRFAGIGERRLVIAIMLTTGLLSTVILSNVAVAAMMLPVVVEVSRRTGHPPSRLLLPLAFGSLLGGMTTMIGTPPSILVAEATRDLGLPAFSLFAITPVGVSALIAGIAFVALLGRRLLPRRDPLAESALPDPAALFELDERLLAIPIPPGSALAGLTIASARLGSALGLTLVAIERHGQVIPAPGRDTLLQSGDRILAIGRPDLIDEIRDMLVSDDDQPVVTGLHLIEAAVQDDSPLVGWTLLESGARQRFRLDVLGVRRGDIARLGDLSRWRVLVGDALLLAGKEGVDDLPADAGLRVIGPISPLDPRYRLSEDLRSLSVPAGSSLVDRTLGEARVRDRLGLAIWEIRREDEVIARPGSDDRLQAGDVLIAQATQHDLRVISALGELEAVAHPMDDLSRLQTSKVGLAAVVLSPQTSLEGKTLRELEFRDRYGLTVVAIWRRGRAYRTGLRDIELRFGDAILTHGPREHLRQLGRDADFIVISEQSTPPPRREKAPVALTILAAVVGSVLLGWLPISVASVAGASLMVLTRCLTMEDAYRHIEWQVVFLIAGMLPLGIALGQTGAASYLAEGVVGLVGPLGPTAVLAGIFLMTSLATQVIPTAALVVMMAPIAYTSAIEIGVSPLPFLMTLAIAASASFSSPVSHPANTLVMGPGGYRFIDFVKVGVPLTLVVFAITMLLVPILWPFSP